MKKEGILSILVLQLLTLVSAYGEQTGITIGGFHLDVDLLILAAVFILSFWAIVFVLKASKIRLNETPKIVLSLILATFSAYGVSKLNVDFQTIFYDLGINKLTTEFGPWFFVITAILIVIIWNLSTFFLVYGTGFLMLGIIGGAIGGVEKWGISILIGIIMIIIGLIIKKKIASKTFSLIGKGIKNIIEQKEKIFKSIKKLEKKIKELEREYMKIYNSNDTDKMKKLEDIKKQIEYLRQRLQELIHQGNQLNQQEKQEVQRQQRQKLDIQTQYNSYSNRIQQIMQKWNRKIPSANSSNPQEKADSAEYSRLSSAMRRLRKIAKDNGIQLK